ncbi:hypothetical protein CPC08DRAFT_707846 [Agrocybe pediades]|nr:hypothetical protein CPC08DRAFT_707846 [Agrocybe pediades]
MNNSFARVFVDDTDPDISYGNGTWSTSYVDASLQPSWGTSPMYGTLHVLEPNPTSPAQMVYEYNGTDVAAHLRVDGGLSVDAFCTLDGKPLFPQKNHSRFICGTIGAVAEGKHQLLIVFPSDQNVLFDYLEYSTSTPEASAMDIIYDSFTPLSKPGDALDFSFLGHSIGVYVSWDEGLSDVNPSNLMYTIDNGPPQYFTVQNPINYINPLDEPQILLQTSQYPLEEHNFHLEFLPPAADNQTVLNIHSIIVQNSETHLGTNLTAFPANQASPTSVGSLSGPTNQPVNIGAIIGGVLGALAAISLLFLVLFVISRRRRARARKTAAFRSVFAMSLRRGANDEHLGHDDRTSSAAKFSLEDSDHDRVDILSLPRLKRDG